MEFPMYEPTQHFTTREAIIERIIFLAVKSANFENYAKHDDHNGNICCDVREHHGESQTKALMNLVEDYTTFVVQSPFSPDVTDINAVYDKYRAIRSMLLR
jgi:hypothetical protein